MQRRNPCYLGCGLETQLIRGMPTSHATTAHQPLYSLLYLGELPRGDLPLDPIGPPMLLPERKSKRAGHFFVNLSAAAPQPDVDGSIDRTTIDAVTFLFRFEDNSSNVFFNWTVSTLVTP